MTDGLREIDDRYLVPALDRGLRILRQFGRGAPVLSLAELAKALSLTPSTAFRLLYTLEQGGLVQKVSGTKNYRLGPGVLTLGFEYLNSIDLVEVARPFLEELRDATQANAHLGARDGYEVVYIARVQARTSLVSTIQVGTRMPLHSNSMGQALLADLDPATLTAMYRGRDLEIFTPNTPASLPDLLAFLEKARRDGYVAARGAIYAEVSSVAAAIRNAEGKAVAAINVVGPDAALVKAGMDTAVRDAVVRTAAAISAALGYRAAAASGHGLNSGQGAAVTEPSSLGEGAA